MLPGLGASPRVVLHPWIEGERRSRAPVDSPSGRPPRAEAVPQVRFKDERTLEDILPLLLAKASADDEDAALIRQIMDSLKRNPPPPSARDLDPIAGSRCITD